VEKMKKTSFTKITALVVTAALSTTLASCSVKTSNSVSTSANSSSGTSTTSTAKIPAKIAAKKSLKFFVVSEIGGDDFTAQYLAGAKAEGKAFDITVDTYSASGDNAKFHDAIAQALTKGYDGFIISHGDDAATVNDVKKIRAKGIPVVSFDSNPDLSKVDGVTLTSQKDEQMVLDSFGQLAQDIDGEGKITYLWVDGFTPMVNRNRIYKALLEKYSSIKEVDRFGVADNNTSVETQNAVAAMLQKYPKGKIKAIFASWDAFAIGASKAIEEANRTDVKVYGIDVSNADLQEIQKKNSPWIATSACDPAEISEIDVRILLQKLAGETTPKYYVVNPTLITKDALIKYGKAVNMKNLDKAVPGWGTSSAFKESWMNSLKK
jgi:simple sugar transport system substrate-binding protein